MKKYFALLSILVLVVACVKESPTFPWYDGSFEEAQQLAGSRVIQLEFYTDT